VLGLTAVLMGLAFPAYGIPGGTAVALVAPPATARSAPGDGSTLAEAAQVDHRMSQ
jgi:hypothetical protein